MGSNFLLPQSEKGYITNHNICFRFRVVHILREWCPSPPTEKRWTCLSRGSGTHKRAWKGEWEREKWVSETESDTLTLPLILLRCVGPAQSKCLPIDSPRRRSKRLLNPIMRLVTLPRTHSGLTGECPHAGPTNTNYVWGFLTLSEHVRNTIVGPAVL